MPDGYIIIYYKQEAKKTKSNSTGTNNNVKNALGLIVK